MNASKPEVKSEAISLAFDRRTCWYLAGLTLVGIGVGYFAGLSESPVVATLIPLLFSLLGGSSGLLLLRATPHDPLSVQRLGISGVALALFAVSCVVASAYAISVRTGAGLSAFIPHWSADSEDSYSIVSKGNSGGDLQIALLDAKLNRLGVSFEDRKIIIAKATNEISSALPTDAVQDIETLKMKVESAFEAIRPFVESKLPLLAELAKTQKAGDDNEPRDKILHPVMLDLYKDLKLAKRLCELWTDNEHKNRASPFSRYAVRGLMDNLNATVMRFEGEHVAGRPRPTESVNLFLWLEDQPVAVNTEALLDYRQYVEDLAAKYGSGEWVGVRDVSAAIDSYIESLGQSTPSGRGGRRRPNMKP